MKGTRNVDIYSQALAELIIGRLQQVVEHIADDHITLDRCSYDVGFKE